MSFLLRFLTHVSRRLNLRALWRGVCWGALVFGALGVLVAIVAVLRGYAAPLLGYGIAAGIGGLCAIILITRWWTNARGVAPYVDQFYGLQDGAVSALHLEQQLTATKGDAPSSTTEAHTLQQRWLEQRLASCDPRDCLLYTSPSPRDS